MDEKAIERIKQRYKLEGRDVYVSAVLVPEKPKAILYAAFYYEGVTVYDFNDEGELTEFGSLNWNDFTEIAIKHLDMKTSLAFHGDGRIRKLTVDNKDGKKIERFTKEQTPVDVYVMKLRWYNKLPGFRSETRWKMIAGAIIYLWIFGLIYNVIF